MRSRARRRLRARDREPGDVAPYSSAASIAKPPQPQPISSTRSSGPRPSLSQIAAELAALGVLERLVLGLEDGARVGHRRVEHQLRRARSRGRSGRRCCAGRAGGRCGGSGAAAHPARGAASGAVGRRGSRVPEQELEEADQVVGVPLARPCRTRRARSLPRVAIRRKSRELVDRHLGRRARTRSRRTRPVRERRPRASRPPRSRERRARATSRMRGESCSRQPADAAARTVGTSVPDERSRFDGVMCAPTPCPGRTAACGGTGRASARAGRPASGSAP